MEEIERRLVEAGYEPVDGGQRGRVFLAPDGAPHAVKVFPEDDRAYLAFVRHAIDAPSPHLPRFLHGPTPLEGGGWAVVMERLDPAPEEAEAFWLDESEGVLIDVINGDRSDALPRAGRWGESLDPAMLEALVGIGLGLMRGLGFVPDPSDGNLMLRRGTPVLTDVVCGRNGRDYVPRSAPPHDERFADLLTAPSSPSP